jgi:hypothetical protein
MYPPSPTTAIRKPERLSLLRARPYPVVTMDMIIDGKEQKEALRVLHMPSPRSVILTEETQGSLFFIPSSVPLNEEVAIHARVSAISNLDEQPSVSVCPAQSKSSIKGITIYNFSDASNGQMAPRSRSDTCSFTSLMLEDDDGSIPEALFFPTI